MSFILDALRRADAQRQQGQVPGLATPQATAWVTPPLAPAAGPRRGRWPVLLAAVAGLGALAAGLAGWMPQGPAPVAVSPAAAPAAASVPTPAPAPAPPPPLAQPPLAPAAAPALPAAAVAPATVRPAVAAPRPPAAPALAAPAPAPAPAAPAERVPLLAELPEAMRAQLPPLNLGGAVWSDLPAQRLVLVGGQVFHEGDVLQPGLTLLRIGRRGVVFSLQGQRFEVPM